MGNQQYSKEIILDLVFEFYKKYDRLPIKKEFGKSKGYGLPSLPTLKIYIGGIKEIGKILDIPLKGKYTETKILEMFSIFYDKYSRPPKQNELGLKKGFNLPGQETVAKYGGIIKICNKLNIDTKYTKEKVIFLITKYIEDNELEYLPIWLEMNPKNNMPSHSTIRRMFPDFKELAELCGVKYEYNKNKFSTAIQSDKYGNFDSIIEYTIFLELLNYFTIADIHRQVSYNKLFDTKTQHIADFYIPKINSTIEATSKGNNIPGYSETKEWKLSVSDNIYFVNTKEEIIDLMEAAGVNKL